MSYPVGQVARWTGVTVRALHHYDEIGLLVPSDRSAAGYRRYSDGDLERLQQILGYRELGFPLEEISAILSDPDPMVHLRRQHALLRERMERLRRMVEAIEHVMEAKQMGIALTPEERFEVFGDFDPDQYADEARERWGGTDAYRQSQQRIASWSKQDWQEVKAESDQIYRRLADAMRSGEPAGSRTAMDLAERHRRHISRFYECGHDTHRGLAEMYVTDQRFTETIDGYAPGLAAYLREAILANADRATGG